MNKIGGGPQIFTYSISISMVLSENFVSFFLFQFLLISCFDCLVQFHFFIPIVSTYSNFFLIFFGLLTQR